MRSQATRLLRSKAKSTRAVTESTSLGSVGEDRIVSPLLSVDSARGFAFSLRPVPLPFRRLSASFPFDLPFFTLPACGLLPIIERLKHGSDGVSVEKRGRR